QVSKKVESAKNEGARVVTGGQIPSNESGYFYPPTLISDVTEEMEVAKDEIFGPVLCIQTAESFDKAIKIANNTKYGLTAAIFSDKINLIGRFTDNIQSGMVHVNQGTAPESHMPFVGMKESSIGQGSVGITTKDFFTDTKTVYISYS